MLNYQIIKIITLWVIWTLLLINLKFGEWLKMGYVDIVAITLSLCKNKREKKGDLDIVAMLQVL